MCPVVFFLEGGRGGVLEGWSVGVLEDWSVRLAGIRDLRIGRLGRAFWVRRLGIGVHRVTV
jgi:hypothetical protein